jgi:hypothetical protein
VCEQLPRIKRARGRERERRPTGSEREERPCGGVVTRARARAERKKQGGCQRRIDRHGLYAGGCVSVGALEFVTTERVCATVSGMATMNIVNLGKLLTDYQAFMALDSLGSGDTSRRGQHSHWQALVGLSDLYVMGTERVGSTVIEHQARLTVQARPASQQQTVLRKSHLASPKDGVP